MRYGFNDNIPSELFLYIEKIDDSDCIITDSLELLDFNQYFYRCLLEDGFQRICFLTFDKKNMTFALITYDEFSYYTYKYFNNENVKNINKNDDEETAYKKIEPLIDQMKKTLHVKFPTRKYEKIMITDGEIKETVQEQLIENWSKLITDVNIQSALVIDMDWASFTQNDKMPFLVRSFYNSKNARERGAYSNKVFFLLSRNSKIQKDGINFLENNGIFSLSEFSKVEQEIKEGFNKSLFDPILYSDKYRVTYPAPRITLESIKYLLLRKVIFNEIPEDSYFIFSDIDDYARYIFDYEKKQISFLKLNDIDVKISKLRYDLKNIKKKVYLERKAVPDDLCNKLKLRIIGQDDHIEEISKKVIDRFNEKKRSNRPLTILAFGGPGIGKSETFVQLFNILNEESDNKWGFIKIGLEQYQEEITVSRLAGAPPGYIGHGDPTPLDKLDNHEYNIVLFDEFEKAHQNLWSFFMNLLEANPVYESYSLGKTINCHNTIFAFTSNVEVNSKRCRSLSNFKRYEYLSNSLIKALLKKGDVNVVKPLVGRIQTKLYFNQIEEMSAIERKLLISKLINDSLKEYDDYKLVEIDKDLLDSITDYFLTLSEGTRSVKNQLSNLGISKAHSEYEENNNSNVICLTGELYNMFIKSRVESKFDFDHHARQIIAQMYGYANWEDAMKAQIRDEEIDLQNQFEKHLNELNSMIGLENVKREISDLIENIKYYEDETKRGHKKKNLYKHIVFTGSPGTGKTTVAKLYGKLLSDLGVLEYGEVKEVKPQELTRSLQGESRKQMTIICEEAFGGVLFIDEAYELNSDDVGREVLDTLNYQLETNKDKFTVILAGYTNQMKRLLSINPGLKSRFSKPIEFPDYSPIELLEIFKSFLVSEDYNFQCTLEAINYVKEDIENAYPSKSIDYGNARAIRNYLDEVIKKLINRVNKENVIGDERRLITLTDVKQVNILDFFK